MFTLAAEASAAIDPLPPSLPTRTRTSSLSGLRLLPSPSSLTHPHIHLSSPLHSSSLRLSLPISQRHFSHQLYGACVSLLLVNMIVRAILERIFSVSLAKSSPHQLLCSAVLPYFRKLWRSVMRTSLVRIVINEVKMATNLDRLDDSSLYCFQLLSHRKRLAPANYSI